MIYFPQKKSTASSIGSISNLANALGVPERDIQIACQKPLNERYTPIEVSKNNGGVRKVYNPSPLIRAIQGRINRRIFVPLIEWPDYLFGSLPNSESSVDGGSVLIKRDYIACAERHCGAKSLVKYDISNFFENIHRDLVLNVFKELLHYKDEVAECLTELCCFGDFLIQGALTSSYLAMLCLWDVEGELVKKLRRRNLVYTRLVDDITISSKKKDQDFRHAERYLQEVMLKKDLPLNDSKMEVMRVGTQPLIIHSLRIDFDTPRLAPGEVARIRAAVHNIECMARVNNFRTSNSYRKQFYRCMGRVNKLARVGHSKHLQFLNKLLKIQPLPSRNDIKKVLLAIKRLKRFPYEERSSRQYKRIYGIAMHRAGIIGRTYIKEQKIILNELKNLKPNALDKN